MPPILSIFWTVQILYQQDAASKGAKTFAEVAMDEDSLAFGITANEAVWKEFGVEKDTVVLFKKVSLLDHLSTSR